MSFVNRVFFYYLILIFLVFLLAKIILKFNKFLVLLEFIFFFKFSRNSLVLFQFVRNQLLFTFQIKSFYKLKSLKKYHFYWYFRQIKFVSRNSRRKMFPLSATFYFFVSMLYVFMVDHFFFFHWIREKCSFHVFVKKNTVCL